MVLPGKKKPVDCDKNETVLRQCGHIPGRLRRTLRDFVVTLEERKHNISLQRVRKHNRRMKQYCLTYLM